MDPGGTRPDRLERLLGIGASRLGTLRVRSALDPFLWLAAFTAPIALAAAIFVDDPIARYVLMAVGLAPTGLAVFASLVLLFGDRDRLQSEEFVLEQRRIAILAQKAGIPGKVTRIDPSASGYSDAAETSDPEDDK